jgi:hypothetical protein
LTVHVLYFAIVTGPDTAYYHLNTIGDNGRVDEIEEYWNARYLSSEEAAWRILGFNVTRKTPAVSALPVHLPSTQHIQYNRLNQNSSAMSPLKHYFMRPIGSFLSNGCRRNFDDLTYCDYFTAFRLCKFSFENAHRPTYFIERDNDDNVAKSHVVLRDTSHPHLSRLQSVRPIDGNVFV